MKLNSLGTGIAMLAVLAGADAAQDFGVVDGLEPLANRHQYYSSHNSYPIDFWPISNDPPSLTSMLDGWNVWEIELDVRYNDEGQSNWKDKYEIFHDCWTAIGTYKLSEALSEITQTTRWQDGFFFLNLETGDAPGTCDDWVDGQTHIPEIVQLVLDHFPIQSIFTENDWNPSGVEGEAAWPSIQELVRSGKRVAIFCNDRIQGSWGVPKIFLHRSQPLSFGDPNSAQWNIDESDKTIPPIGDGNMSRYFPADSLCTLGEELDWDEAWWSGFNFPATNCIDNSEFYEERFYFHPPYPMYAVPLDLNQHADHWGVVNDPLEGVDELLWTIENWIQFYNSRPPIAPSGASRAGIIPIKMKGGHPWDFTNGGASPQVLEGPVVLVADSSVVTLQ